MSKTRKALRLHIRPHLQALVDGLKIHAKAIKDADKARKHWAYYIGTEGNPFIDSVTLGKCEQWLTETSKAEHKAREQLAPLGLAVRNAVRWFKNYQT
jgi:hypothetical protein